jgi:hypothetical protein
MLEYEPAPPGAWLAAVDDAQVLMVHTDAARATRLHGALGDGAGAVLDILTADGLRSVPPFALAMWERVEGADGRSLRVIVRGEVTVTVVTESGETTVSGAGVASWTERLHTDAIAFRVSTGTSAEPGLLSLASGVVFAGGVISAEMSPAPDEHAAVADEHEIDSVADVDDATVVVPRTRRSTRTDPERVDAVARAGTSEPAPETPATDSEPHIELPPFMSDSNPRRTPAHVDAATPSVEAGAPAPSAAPPTAPSELPASQRAAEPGDHDGLTVMSDDIRALRERPRPSRVSEATIVPAQRAYHLVLPSGTYEPITQPVLVGRSPTVTQVSGGRVPKLVTVGAGDQDISRNHVQFSLEGDTVIVTDLHSRNGTLLTFPGAAPLKLRAGEPTAAIAGTSVDLGGGIVLEIRED